MKKWLPISEAASKLEISDRALYYRIEKGKVESKIEDGNRFVRVDVSENISESASETISEVFQQLFEEKDVKRFAIQLDERLFCILWFFGIDLLEKLIPEQANRTPDK